MLLQREFNLARITIHRSYKELVQTRGRHLYFLIKWKTEDLSMQASFPLLLCTVVCSGLSSISALKLND